MGDATLYDVQILCLIRMSGHSCLLTRRSYREQRPKRPNICGFHQVVIETRLPRAPTGVVAAVPAYRD